MQKSNCRLAALLSPLLVITYAYFYSVLIYQKSYILAIEEACNISTHVQTGIHSVLLDFSLTVTAAPHECVILGLVNLRHR